VISGLRAGRKASNPLLEGIEAIMFRAIGDQPSRWESLLPEQVLRLPGEVARLVATLAARRSSYRSRRGHVVGSRSATARRAGRPVPQLVAAGHEAWRRRSRLPTAPAP
jgi:hypothetical protein